MPQGDSQRRGLILAVLTLLASGWLAAFGITLWRLHTKATADGFVTARMHARNFEDYLTKTLQVIDLSVGNLPAIGGLQDTEDIAAHLTGLLRPSPFLRSLSILTSDGRVIAGSDARNLDLRIDLEGFYPDAGLSGAQLRIGRPWLGRDLANAMPSTGEPPPPRSSSLVPVMRRFVLAGETYWWLAALNPDDVIDHFSQLLPIEEGRVQLLRYDGLLLLSSSPEDIPGRIDQAGEVPVRLERQELGEFEQTPADGRCVLTSYRASSRYPIVIAVHLDRSYIQTQWLGEAGRLSMVVVPILGALSVAILLLWLRRRLHEAELLAAKERAETAARAKTTFLSTMSHELRTPMHGILGMTELLLESDLSERQRRQLETVKRSADSLMAILADILDYTRLEAEDIQLQCGPCDPLQVVREVMSLFTPQAEKKGLRLRLDSGVPAPGTVIADRQGLRQILAKLTSNAVKFTHEGEIVLSAWLETEATGREILAIRVTDTGIGIPGELHATIFEPFVQADGSHTRRYGGTGLGLAIARRLAEAMGGTLELESAPDRGSRFTLRIPVQPPARRRNPSPESLPG